MSTEFYANDGTSWRKAKEVSNYVGNVNLLGTPTAFNCFLEPAIIYCYDSTAWRKIYDWVKREYYPGVSPQAWGYDSSSLIISEGSAIKTLNLSTMAATSQITGISIAAPFDSKYLPVSSGTISINYTAYVVLRYQTSAFSYTTWACLANTPVKRYVNPTSSSRELRWGYFTGAIASWVENGTTIYTRPSTIGVLNVYDYGNASGVISGTTVVSLAKLGATLATSVVKVIAWGASAGIDTAHPSPSTATLISFPGGTIIDISNDLRFNGTSWSAFSTSGGDDSGDAIAYFTIGTGTSKKLYLDNGTAAPSLIFTGDTGPISYSYENAFIYWITSGILYMMDSAGTLTSVTLSGGISPWTTKYFSTPLGGYGGSGQLVFTASSTVGTPANVLQQGQSVYISTSTGAITKRRRQRILGHALGEIVVEDAVAYYPSTRLGVAN